MNKFAVGLTAKTVARLKKELDKNVFVSTSVAVVAAQHTTFRIVPQLRQRDSYVDTSHGQHDTLRQLLRLFPTILCSHPAHSLSVFRAPQGSSTLHLRKLVHRVCPITHGANPVTGATSTLNTGATSALSTGASSALSTGASSALSTGAKSVLTTGLTCALSTRIPSDVAAAGSHIAPTTWGADSQHDQLLLELTKYSSRCWNRPNVLEDSTSGRFYF